MVTIQQKENYFLQILFLHGLRTLAGERTIQSFYYIVKGRKGHQTYQDVHAYSLHSFYRLFPSLSVVRWNEIIQYLESSDLIRFEQLEGFSHKSTFYLTENGQKTLQVGSKQYALDTWLHSIDHYQLSTQLRVFWLKLHLMVQTVSHLLYQDMAFIPVVQDKKAQGWVKQTLSSNHNKQQWMNELFHELFYLLQKYPDQIQQVIVRQLSGAPQVGQTLQQLALQLDVAPSYLHVQMSSVLADILKRLSRAASNKYPLLSQLCTTSVQNGAHVGLSESTIETLQLLKKGKSLAEIARLRTIKISTVEDHLVEIILHSESVDISTYLSTANKNKILLVQKELNTKRLRLLKEQLGDQFSYLQIRLALALGGKKSDE